MGVDPYHFPFFFFLTLPFFFSYLSLFPYFPSSLSWTPFPCTPFLCLSTLVSRFPLLFFLWDSRKRIRQKNIRSRWGYSNHCVALAPADGLYIGSCATGVRAPMWTPTWARHAWARQRAYPLLQTPHSAIWLNKTFRVRNLAWLGLGLGLGSGFSYYYRVRIKRCNI